MNEIYREVTALSTQLKIEWPRNVLRHAFISYRLPIVKNTEQVALGAATRAAVCCACRRLSLEAIPSEARRMIWARWT